VGPVGAAFPGVIKDGAVDRTVLSAAVIGNDAAMSRLEAIVHPLVGRAQQDWLKAEAARGAPMVVLDIPLLLEGGGEARVDVVVVVSAPEAVQCARVLQRPGMSPEKLAAILAKQMPDAEKRKRADFVIDTGQTLDATFADLKALVDRLKHWPARVWRE